MVHRMNLWSWNSCTKPFMRRKSLLCRSSARSSSFRRDRSGSIHSFSSSFWIIALIDLSSSTSVQAQHPKRLSPQLGVVVVDDERTFAVCGGALIHGQQVLVVDTPRGCRTASRTSTRRRSTSPRSASRRAVGQAGVGLQPVAYTAGFHFVPCSRGTA